MKKTIISRGFIVALLCSFYLSNSFSQEISYSEKMAESIMARRSAGYGGWDYVSGTVMRGFEETWRVTNNNKYFNYIKKTVDLGVYSSGGIKSYNMGDYNIDEIKEGTTALLMYKIDHSEKYIKAAHTLREQLENHPRTHSGGFWHKNRYPWQIWLDGLYMGSPFYTEYSAMFNDSTGLDDVVHQITEIEILTRDTITGLLYHGWDESKTQDWADPVTGTSESFWGRAVGWYAMAMVDVLDYLPYEHQGRDTIIGIFNRLADAIVNCQDTESHVWWQVLDRANEPYNYKESSASCMFVYSLAKAMRLGYIDDSYRDAIINGYNGIIDEFITTNNGLLDLNYTCATAGLGYGRDGSYEYYTQGESIRSNDGKALGPFLLASVEIEMMDKIYPPGNLFIDDKTSGSLVLSWKDNSQLDTNILIERKTGGNFIQIASLAAGTTTYTDSEFDNSTTFEYRVRACNSTDTSVYSNEVSTEKYVVKVLPVEAFSPTPADQTDSVSYAGINLSWETGINASSVKLYLGTTNPPDFEKNLTSNSYTTDALEPDTTYYWRVDVVNHLGVTEGNVWEFTTMADTQSIDVERIFETDNIFKVYPNPATTESVVTFKNDVFQGGSITIVDVTGSTLQSLRINKKVMNLDLSVLSEGIYLLNITDRYGIHKKQVKLLKR